MGTELVGTSISSSFDADLIDLAEQIIGDLDWVHYVNARGTRLRRRGGGPRTAPAKDWLVDTALETPCRDPGRPPRRTVEATPFRKSPSSRARQ
ncbi:MAG: hypothetical protein U5R31_06160 [Acidimicrobiia bacterium]|nr:hypothetical protein [Acidimicrobiia bacterium]